MLRYDTAKSPVRPLFLAALTTRPGARQYARNFRLTGMSGMGGMGLATDNPQPSAQTAQNAATAIHNTQNFIDSIAAFFGIGAGRREADAIVPFQNAAVNNVIAPVSAAVNAPDAYLLSCGQLDEMLNALLACKTEWLRFLHQTVWSDGRAAVQAEATLAPYWDDQERKTRALMVNCHTNYGEILTGAPPIPGIEPVHFPGTTPIGTTPGTTPHPVYTAGFPSTSSSLPLLALGAAAIYFFSKRRGK